jgi:hypothetical protein
LASGFRPNRKGYLEVLNGGEAYRRCDRKGAEICAAINAASGGGYASDTIYGKNRVHTRVKTTDTKSFFRERHHRTLALWAHRKATS